MFKGIIPLGGRLLSASLKQ